MKKHLPAVALTAVLATAAVGCHGSYRAMGKLTTWNGHATGNKVANSAIHLGLWIVPVYPLAILADFLIFNNVEFVTGSNPLD